MTLLYQPMFRVHGAATFVPFGSPTAALSVAVSGLNPNTNYDFEIVASNSFGTTPSTIVVASTTTASGAPPAGSVGGSQTSGTAAPVITGPSSGTAVTAGTLAVTGVTITDNNVSVLLGSSAALTDAQGNTWTLNAANNGSLWENGAPPNGQFSANTTQMVNIGGVIYMVNTSGQWYYWDTTALIFQAVNTGSSPIATGYTLTVTTTAGTLTMPGAAGAAPFILAPTTAVVSDTSGNNWGISSAGAVTKNGAAVTTPGTPTVVTPTSGGSVTDSAGHVWTLNAAGTTVEDGNVISAGSQTSAITVFNGTLYAQDRTSLNWFTWSGTAFIAAATAPPTSALAVVEVAYVSSLIWEKDASANWYSTPTTGTPVWTGPTTTSPLGTVGGNGTATVTMLDTLANTQSAVAGLVLTAPNAATTLNVKISYFDIAHNTSSITIPVGVVAPVAPSPPTGLTATALTTTTATLTYVASTTGTPPITYQPQYRVHGNPTWTSFGSPIAGLSVVVTGLVASTPYDFQTLAINQAGSVASAPAVGTTAAAGGTPPSAPAGLVASP